MKSAAKIERNSENKAHFKVFSNDLCLFLFSIEIVSLLSSADWLH